MKDVQHDLWIAWKCPNCGYSLSCSSTTVLFKPKCQCGIIFHVQKTTDGVSTVRYDIDRLVKKLEAK